mmetsp:Transcript_5036/g.8835  ORF Transcript_5036/g.8835 Transcript_5036/m.8835 type:complete len:447 (-) Transcript_5036:110-1450(-)
MEQSPAVDGNASLPQSWKVAVHQTNEEDLPYTGAAEPIDGTNSAQTPYTYTATYSPSEFLGGNVFASENDDGLLGTKAVGLPLTHVKSGHEGNSEPGRQSLGYPVKPDADPNSPIQSPRSQIDEGLEGGSAPSTPGRRRRTRGRRPPGGNAEFNVTIDKRHGGTHGIDIDWSSGVTLLIEKVNKPGLVASWNAAHPDLEIRDGHSIIEVNGVKGNALNMLEEMKKDQLLNVVIRSSPAGKPEQPVAAELNRSSAQQKTALKSNAPIFQPKGSSAPGVDPGLSLGVPPPVGDLWLAPDGMKPEFVDAVQALKLGLSSSIAGGWWLDATTTTSSSVSFGGVSPAMASPAVLASAKQAILAIVAQFPSVFLMGRSTNPFEALGPHGFRLSLASLLKESLDRICWDTLGRGFCPRGASCTWKHPSESDLLEVKLMLVPAELMMQFPPPAY